MFLLKLKAFLLSGKSFKLRPHELAVLDAWRERLSATGKSVLADQLNYLIAYRRNEGGKVLTFSTLNKQPYAGLPEEVLFPCKLKACVVALVHLRGVDRKQSVQTLRAEVELDEGQLIFLQFNQRPADLLAGCIVVTQVDILRDAMIPISEATISDAERREDVMKTLLAKLPDEYLQLVGQGKGVVINDWTVLAVHKIREIVQGLDDYYALAEKEDGDMVAVKKDEWSGQLYYLPYNYDSGEKITVGFRKFLETWDGGEVEGRF